MGGKKTIEKSREWEKERRDKLNHNFLELGKLLPDHDPALTLSKKQILTQAAEYIKLLQEQNKQILKEGTDSVLRIEAERLKRRVAQLLLKTKLLVDALRTAGVPIPRKKNDKQSQNKKQRPNSISHSSNQNKINGKKKVTEVENTTQEKDSKKKVKCGCDKVKSNSHKNPLKEINSTVQSSSAVTSTTSSTGKLVVSTSTTSTSYSENKVAEVQKSVSSSLLIPISHTGIISGSVVAPGSIQTLAPVLDRNILSNLGPGTLILADGRVVSMPPIVPQIVMKPQPAVIVMQNTKKKEKLLIPKRDVTKTTFANKAPIPAIKHYRLESPRTKTTASRNRVKKLKTTILASSKVFNQSSKQIKKTTQSDASNNSISASECSDKNSTNHMNSQKEKEDTSSIEVEEDVGKVQAHSCEDHDAVMDTGVKRKNEDAADLESNKILKLVRDSNTENLLPSEEVISEIDNEKLGDSEVQSQLSDHDTSEVNQSETTIEMHADKEDALKLNQNKYTIDALFNKSEDPQGITKSASPIKDSVVGLSYKDTTNQVNHGNEMNGVSVTETNNEDNNNNNNSTIITNNNNGNDSTETAVETQQPPPLAVASPVQSSVPSVSISERIECVNVGDKQNQADATKSNSKQDEKISTLPPTSLSSSSSSELVSDVISSSSSTAVELTTKTTTTLTNAAYSNNSENGSYKIDCNLSSVDFLRSRELQDQRNTFMPIIDDVRLTSEFSSDLFNSLQVPSAIGGQHPESISPTAAFLLAFPLVSTSKNADNPVDNENHENQHTNTPTTFLQIGNIDPPGSTELFHSIDYQNKNTKQFLGKDTVDRFHSFELSAEYETNITGTSDVQKAYRSGSNDKKKETSNYLSHEECRSKSQRRQCEVNVTQERAKESQNILVATSGVCTSTNDYQQHQTQPQQQQQQQCYGGYPLFTNCNDFSSVMPSSTSQYSSVGVGTDPKTDVINMLPWTTTSHINQQQDYSPASIPHLDKDACVNQKNKHTYDRKSKSDKVAQKSCNYNFNQYSAGNECYVFKQDKKKGKQNQMSRPPVNWMTAPDSRNILSEPLPHLDMYTPQKEVDSTPFPLPPPPPPPPPTGVAQNPFTNTFSGIEMSIDGFPEFCSSKKATNNYCWSPSKCLLPPSVDNHGLAIPSTLPTLVGDLALGTTTTAMDNTYKPFENNRKFDHSTRKLPEKVESIKKRNEFPVKNQASNSSFLSVSQLVDPKCKKQTKHHGQQVDMNKNCGVKRHSGGNHSDKGSVKNLQRANCNYSSSSSIDRKDHRLPEPNCMYSTSKNSLPSVPNQWNDKQRNPFKGGSYSAESLIGVQHQNMNQSHEIVSNSDSLVNISGTSSFHHSNNLSSGTNYHTVQSSSANYFHSADYPVQQPDTSHSQGSQQYNQNCFNLTATQPPHFSTGFVSEDYQVDNFVGFSTGPSAQCQPQQAPTGQGHHHHHHQQQQQAVVEHTKQKRQVNNSNNSGGKCGPREDHNSRVANESTYHNPRLASSSNMTTTFIQPPPPPPPPPQVYHPGYSLPPPSKADISYGSTTACSQHIGLTTNTTTTLTNFNLSTIFPEMNDHRGPPSSTTHLNASFANLSSHSYHHHHPPPPPLRH